MKNKILYLTSVIFIVLYSSLLFSKKESEENYELMIEAANRMKVISQNILEEKVRRNIVVDKSLDINMTGLIGEEYTEMTTTLGNLESKRTSVNPDFSAFFIKLLKSKNLKKGDHVAVNMSSSFPALNLAFIVALDLLELENTIISSVGSSTYGANNIDFNYLDMEDFLLQNNLIQNYSKAYSLGGDNDAGLNFQNGYKEYLLERPDKMNRKLIYLENYNENLKTRINLYSQKPVKLFINIGGNLVSEDLIKKFEGKGVETISLLNIKSFALKNGIMVDPFPLPEVGTSELYKVRKNNPIEYLIFLFFIFFLLFCLKTRYKQCKIKIF